MSNWSCRLQAISVGQTGICIRKTRTNGQSEQGRRPDQARLLAVTSAHSGDWLHALPLSGCGLRLDDRAIHIAVGLRLGANICEPHQCPCGAMVDAKGLHGLSCKGGSGRSARHHSFNDLVWRALSKADIPTVKEPSGLLRTDGKRPDGVTHIMEGWKVCHGTSQ